MKLLPAPTPPRCPEKVSGLGNLKPRPQWWRSACASLSLAMLAACGINASAQVNWIDTNLGNPTLKGSTTANGGGIYTIIGGGDDIWNATSDCHFYYAWGSGQTWDAIVQVQSFTGPDAWSKVELMVDNADPVVGPQGNDAFIAVMQTQPSSQNGGVNNFGSAQYRTVRGNGANNAITGTTGVPTPPNTWMKLHRNGSVFSVEYSYDGVTWVDYADVDTASTAYGFGQTFPDSVAVGIAVTAHNDADTGGATAVIKNLSVTFPAVTAPTVVNATVQVTNTTATLGCEASVSFVTTNNSSPNVVLPTYQWYKNNVAISNATGTSLTWLASASDNNAKVYCKATVPPPYNTTVSSLTSATGTVTVVSGIFVTNGLKTELFSTTANIANVEAGNVVPAGKIFPRTNADDPGGYGNNYVSRVSGYFIPTKTDNYVFFLAVDDSADLYLSTDSSAENKRLIATQNQWCAQDQWLLSDSNGVAGNGSATLDWGQKESDTYTPDSGFTFPGATGYALSAGTKYYIEVVHSQGGGGDNLGLTYTPFSQLTSLTNGQPSAMNVANANIAFITYQDTTPTWTLQPTNITVAGGLPVTFSASAISGGEFPPNYQWYSNSVPIPGAINSSLSVASVPLSANGAQFYAVATSYMSGLSSTSASATLNVSVPVLEKGYTKIEYWLTITDRTIVENGKNAPADHIITSPRFEGTSANNGSGFVNYVSRLTTLFYPTTTGNYIFFVNSDDASDLYVSTDSTAGNKTMVAQETGWSNPWQWNAVGGGSTLSQKRSDTWQTNAAAPWAAGIPMTAGQAYYIELDHQDTGGGNNAEATWKLTTDPDPVNGDLSKFTGNYTAINVARSFNAGFTQQPTNVTVANYASASFSVAATNDSTTAVGTTGDPSTLWNNTVAYQWYRNGVLQSGATSPTYKISSVQPTDTSVFCTTRGLGYANSLGLASSVTSSVANITVDLNQPQMTYAAFYTNQNVVPFTGAVGNYITVAFSLPMDSNMLSQASTYTVGGGVTILDVMVSSDNQHVTLMVSGVPTYPLNVTVSALLHAQGGGLAVSNTVVAVATMPLINIDIGLNPGPGGDPAVAGLMYATGPQGYVISAEGSDIYNAADGFNFAYEMKTNDFDVVVRQKSITHTSNWAKGGLMVRETLDPASRNWNIVNDPSTLDGIGAPDGSGNGANAVESNARISTGGASAGWGTSGVPYYPNAWVRLTRVGGLLSSYSSTNGTSWILRGSSTPAQVGDSNALPSVVYVGICTTAHNNDLYNADPLLYLNTASYDNYNSSYVATAPLVVLSAAHTGNNITVTWTPNTGHLESSPALSGAGVNWQPVSGGTGGTVTVPATGGGTFFRVVTP